MTDSVTSGEAAKRLGVSVALLRKLEANCITPPARRLSRFRIYTDDEIERLRKVIDERRSSPGWHPFNRGAGAVPIMAGRIGDHDDGDAYKPNMGHERADYGQ